MVNLVEKRGVHHWQVSPCLNVFKVRLHTAINQADLWFTWMLSKVKEGEGIRKVRIMSLQIIPLTVSHL